MRIAHIILVCCTVMTGPGVLLGSGPQSAPATSDWPAGWLAAWSDPPAELRPLQIVHSLPPAQAIVEALREFKDLGAGGIVCNVSFKDYLTSEPNWQTLVQVVESCRQMGLLVWIYDEEGYPSGAAGGLVLKDNPRFEAIVLAYDPSQADPFILRPAYEYTHASNNFHAARRYPNLLDEGAVGAFIEKTHEAYWRRLQQHFGSTIRATFTDEPSLMALDTGQLSEEVRKRVPVKDPLDPTVRPLPCVPWVEDLPQQYQARYGQDLMAVRKSLFTGQSEADRQVRRRYWALIADLVADRYFGRLEKWCEAHGVASSGHSLWEERPLHHVPLEGNALQCLRRMHIPGLDMLSSTPDAVFHGGWLAAALPASAALIEGRRQVMTEVSDFSEQMASKGPASLSQMQATAAWQAALGVTEFTLYYNRRQRPAADTRAYMEFVGRLNALLRDARPDPDVLLYYPIYDLWAEYVPMARPLTLESQSALARQLIDSFMRLGRHLATAQVPFMLADHETLAGAEVREGRLWVGRQSFTALVLPDGVELPDAAARIVEQFRPAGGHVLRDDMKAACRMGEEASRRTAAGRLHPAFDQVVLGRFKREGREILLLVNVGKQDYKGELAVAVPGRWTLADPADSGIREITAGPTSSGGGRIALSLAAGRTLLLVGPASR